MANLNITELASQGRDNGNNLLPVMKFPAVTIQNAAIGGSSVQSSAFNANTNVVRLSCDIACYVLIGSNPTVTTSNGLYMGAGTAEYVSVAPSQKLAVIAA